MYKTFKTTHQLQLYLNNISKEIVNTEKNKIFQNIAMFNIKYISNVLDYEYAPIMSKGQEREVLYTVVVLHKENFGKIKYPPSYLG